MIYVREIESYHKGGKLQNPYITPVVIPTRVLLGIFGSKVFDQLKKEWIEDDVDVVWIRKISQEEGVRIEPFLPNNFKFTFETHDYYLSTTQEDDLIRCERVKSFLDWLLSNEHKVFYDYFGLARQQVIFCIDEKIDSLFNPNLKFEIDKINQERAYISLSPALSNLLLPTARAIVETSKKHAFLHWEFCLGRQRRPWSDIVRIAQSEKSSFSEIDLSKWKYLVFRVLGSELFDIVFSCGENCPLSDNDLDEIATLVTVGLLGEMFVLEKINQIEVVKAFDGDKAKRAKSAELLPYEFGMNSLSNR